ncbi:FtsB family cell division protein [Inquilinus limosus]|uniref:FtsB family cell division protein n=1 Tax=Inquilinus limosus TaxID=171674 RepID=UPI0006910167|nr:septum formation initiator family protein [Inquilinus limosus]
MSMFRFLRRKLRPVIGPAVGVCLIAYFTYHAIQGDHGIFARDALQGEVAQAKATLESLTAQRTEMEKRAALIDPKQIDTDMLDERARAMLNVARPDDVVIFFPKAAPAPAPAQ